jgi:hypothetical protein
MNTHETAKLIKFTERGHTVHLASQHYSNVSQSGYESPESFCQPYHWWADKSDTTRVHYENMTIPDSGVPVLDIRQATQTPEGVSWVFKGPLLDVDLPDGQVSELPTPDPLFAGAVANNAYGKLLAIHAGKEQGKRGALDSVSVSEYINGWKEHGGKVGRFYVRNGQASIEWEK